MPDVLADASTQHAGKIVYVVGDAVHVAQRLGRDGAVVVAHCVSTSGTWGCSAAAARIDAALGDAARVAYVGSHGLADAAVVSVADVPGVHVANLVGRTGEDVSAFAFINAYKTATTWARTHAAQILLYKPSGVEGTWDTIHNGLFMTAQASDPAVIVFVETAADRDRCGALMGALSLEPPAEETTPAPAPTPSGGDHTALEVAASADGSAAAVPTGQDADDEGGEEENIGGDAALPDAAGTAVETDARVETATETETETESESEAGDPADGCATPPLDDEPACGTPPLAAPPAPTTPPPAAVGAQKRKRTGSSDAEEGEAAADALHTPAGQSSKAAMLLHVDTVPLDSRDSGVVDITSGRTRPVPSPQGVAPPAAKRRKRTGAGSNPGPPSAWAQRKADLAAAVAVPLNTILKGVVLAMSGYSADAKRDIRAKVEAMGGTIHDRWPSYHKNIGTLICETMTEDYDRVMRHVRPRPVILMRKYIDACHSASAQLPFPPYQYSPTEDDGSSTEGDGGGDGRGDFGVATAEGHAGGGQLSILDLGPMEDTEPHGDAAAAAERRGSPPRGLHSAPAVDPGRLLFPSGSPKKAAAVAAAVGEVPAPAHAHAPASARKKPAPTPAATGSPKRSPKRKVDHADDAERDALAQWLKRGNPGGEVGGQGGQAAVMPPPQPQPPQSQKQPSQQPLASQRVQTTSAPLPRILTGCVVLIHTGDGTPAPDALERYIASCDGELAESPDDDADVTHIVSTAPAPGPALAQVLQRVQAAGGSPLCVSSDWIWCSVRAHCKLDATAFGVSPP